MFDRVGGSRLYIVLGHAFEAPIDGEIMHIKSMIPLALLKNMPFP